LVESYRKRPPISFVPPKDRIRLVDFSSSDVFLFWGEVFLFWGRLAGDLKALRSWTATRGVETMFLEGGAVVGSFSAKDLGEFCFFFIPPKP
jgi:hypothetical protein